MIVFLVPIILIIIFCLYFYVFNNKQKYMVIIRGIPGIKNSNYANNIKNALSEIEVASYENYFMENNLGSYNLSQLNLAHTYCLNQILESINNNKKMIIFDNFNISMNEIKEYVLLSNITDYDLIIVTFVDENKDINILHEKCNKSIPKEVVNKMIKLWEEDDVINKKIKNYYKGNLSFISPNNFINLLNNSNKIKIKYL